MRQLFALLPLSLVLLAACAEEDGNTLSGQPGYGDNPGADASAPGSDVAPQTCSGLQITYTGFGGESLVAGRVETEVNLDRRRMKPFIGLAEDYKRVLGVSPSLIAESGPTFGDPPARWYSEPQPGAVNLYQAYRIAFEGCVEYTSKDEKYAAAPDATTAATECSAFARKFWSRTASQEETDACAKLATTDSLKENPTGAGVVDTTPRRRWAYACAAVLSADGFLMY